MSCEIASPYAFSLEIQVDRIQAEFQALRFRLWFGWAENEADIEG